MFQLRGALGDEDPAEEVAVAAKVFGGAMEDVVCAMEEGVLEGRGREGGVDAEEGALGVCALGVGCD